MCLALINTNLASAVFSQFLNNEVYRLLKMNEKKLNFEFWEKFAVLHHISPFQLLLLQEGENC